MEKNLSYCRTTINKANEYLHAIVTELKNYTPKRIRMDQVRLTSTLGPMEFLASCAEIASNLGCSIPEYTLHIIQHGGDSLSWTITFTLLDIELS